MAVLKAAVRHFWTRSWYRQSRSAVAPGISYLPSPQMTAQQETLFDEPAGTAGRWVRIGYLSIWSVQLLAAVTAAAAAATLITRIVTATQAKSNACKTGAPGCTDIAVPVAGPVLLLLLCIVLMVAGRPARRFTAEQIRNSARRVAARSRTPLQHLVVLLAPLPTRSRWLLTAADRMLDNFPPELAGRVLWDIARRLDAAAALTALNARALPELRTEAAQTAYTLTTRAEADVAALRQAVLVGKDYRHRPCRTTSLSSLPRAQPATMISDARLLLPKDTSDRPTARSYTS